MKYYILLLSVLLVSAGSATVVASEQNSVIYDAEYEGKFSGLTVAMSKKLINMGNARYHIESRANNFLGSIDEDSHFINHAGTLIPLSYSENRKLLGKRSDRRLTFDWKTKIVHYERKDKPNKNKHTPLSDGFLDPALYQLKLQQEAYAQINQMRFAFIKDGRVKHMAFTKTASSTYTLGKKTYASVVYERVIDEGKKGTSVTLIPELDYMIAKIEHTEKDGAKYNIRLTKLNYNKNALETFYRSISPLNETLLSKTEAL